MVLPIGAMVCVVFFFLVIVGIIVLALLYNSWASKKLAEVCQAKGYSFYGNSVPMAREMIKGSTMDRGYAQRILFGVGRNYKGLDVSVFQWQYTVSSGKHTHTYFYKVALLYNVPFRQSGWLFLRKEGLLDKMGGIFGMNDLDFENSEFSRKFYVKAKPERWGFDFFHPRMIELFLRYPAYAMLVKGNTIMLYQQGTLGGFGMFWALRRTEIPFQGFMDSTAEMFYLIHSNLPKLMVRKEARVLPGDEEDGPGEGGGKEVVCPNCAREFKVARGARKLRCPGCGVEGEM